MAASKAGKVVKETKVKVITKKNFSATKKRAAAIQNRLKKHLAKTGMFPSHAYVIEKWGYNICAKAVMRHKKQVCKDQNIDMPDTDPKCQIKRKSKAKVSA